jgi:hypothetical protein
MRRGVNIGGRTRARFIIALVALFAFTLQTYVVQTHIHIPGAETALTGNASTGHKTPTGDGSDDCPVCQAFALAGAFVTPAIVIFALALTYIEVAPRFALRATSGPLFVRNWRSRAPPRQ